MQVLLLAAGRGSRFRPLSDTVPKPLINVFGKPLIVYQIEHFLSFGYRHFLIHTGYLGDQVEAYLGDGSSFGVEIAYDAHKAPQGVVSGIRGCLSRLEDVFFVSSCDIIHNIDLCRLTAGWSQKDGGEGSRVSTCSVVKNPHHHPDGDFDFSGLSSVLSIGSTWTYAGVGYWDRSFFEREGETLSALMLEAIKAGEGCRGVVHGGDWVNVDHMDRITRKHLG